jgi:hypothetical protein
MRRCQMPNLAIFAGCLTLKAFGMVPILAAAVVQPPPVAVEPTRYWAAPNGLAYDLRSIFHEVLRFRVRGDPRRRVEVSLGGAVLCTPRTNPRRVAVCAHDVDGTPAVLGLKANFRFEEMADPEGFRLWYEHQSQSFTLDFFCSETEFPATLDYLDRITDPEITGFAASYFGRITSVVGCGFVLPDFGESEVAEPDHSGPGLVWRALVGGQSFRYSSRSVLGTQLLVELNPPHALDALEISLGSPIPCGMGQDEVVAVCFYPTEQPPVAAGYNASLQLRRAHRGGVDIHLRGAQCTATREYWTHISVVCQARGEASSLWAWRSDGAGCDLFVEMVSPLGCGIETGTKPAAHSAPQESLEVRGDNPSPDSDMTEFQPDVNTFGCVDGDCENGQGTFRWRTDSTYHGTWLNGMRYGHGEHEWPDGRKYIGDWSNNVRSGWGTHIFANRDVYTGTVCVGFSRCDLCLGLPFQPPPRAKLTWMWFKQANGNVT